MRQLLIVAACRCRRASNGGRPAPSGSRRDATRAGDRARPAASIRSSARCIALDPTAMEQARRVDASGVSGPARRPAGPDQGQYRGGGAASDDCRKPRPRQQCHQPRCAPCRAAARRRAPSSSARPICPNGRTSARTIRSPGWSAVGGQTRNPWALDRNPCGSSSGSGAAVAAGLVRLAIGTETDGSITCPAAINGIVGLKPTVGLVSRTHIVPISHSQDTAGPMTASVREAAELLTIIAGSDPADRADARGRYAQAQLCRGARCQLAQGQAHRRDALRCRISARTPRSRPRWRCCASAGATLVEIKKFDDSAIGKNELQRPADRVQDRPQPLSEKQPGTDPGAHRSPT